MNSFDHIIIKESFKKIMLVKRVDFSLKWADGVSLVHQGKWCWKNVWKVSGLEVSKSIYKLSEVLLWVDLVH